MQTLATIIVRPKAAEKLRKLCAVQHDYHLAVHIGVSPPQVSRVLSGKDGPSRRFIAGVIDRCGLEFAFREVFEVVPDEDA